MCSVGDGGKKININVFILGSDACTAALRFTQY